MKRLARLNDRIEGWNKLIKSTADTLELAEMGDEEFRVELEAETAAIEKEVDRREFNAMLSGEYDRGNAIFAIHAGAGGTDSQDWAEMLQRMYLRWMEQHNYEINIIDSTPGEEAGIQEPDSGCQRPLCLRIPALRERSASFSTSLTIRFEQSPTYIICHD